ncbi:MAG: hypothetical protein RUMPE_01133 [Eubacteriales bacterium SKADARSKE-1]|nr:hypothetical protein [Eubacteriales bacterium SKADARSKE-1]
MEKEKALVIFGSPRNNGYTKKMLNLFMNELKEIYDFSIINAYDIAIKPCYGCDFCEKNGVCRFSDFNKIKMLLDETDMLVIASPVYNMGFPAPLKAIFDRMQVYYNKPLQREKDYYSEFRDAVLLLTCGRADNGVSEILSKSLNYILKCIDIKIKYKTVWEKTDLNPNDSGIFLKIKMVSKSIMEIKT